jgi:hypothetical protein
MLWPITVHRAIRGTLTFLSGMDWDTASSHKVPDEIDGIPVFVIGRADYIVNKKASGRAKDLADIEALGERIHHHRRGV